VSDAPPEDGPVIRDRRRFDPTTGEMRAGAADQVAPDAPIQPDPTNGAGSELEAQVAERTADLQRLQAEYANYRRRVERDRQAVGEAALASVFANLLPVLDDIDRARSHGEVVDGFERVADALEAALTKLGLERFGEAGEPFDPTLHEALTHGFSVEVTEPICAEVFQSGYRVGERVLRPARVAVLEPETAVLADLDPTFDATIDATIDLPAPDDGQPAAEQTGDVTD
jgi:molecular chaperone GrpE